MCGVQGTRKMLTSTSYISTQFNCFEALWHVERLDLGSGAHGLAGYIGATGSGCTGYSKLIDSRV